jgi:hypothetical protein
MGFAPTLRYARSPHAGPKFEVTELKAGGSFPKLYLRIKSRNSCLALRPFVLQNKVNYPQTKLSLVMKIMDRFLSVRAEDIVLSPAPSKVIIS